jgi:DNA polymerase-3 subunit gamma/tau
MSYTVLARKWRPKNFAELVGQTHVMQALSNALDQNRLHHAYLFTGTRGVGKTTIARIFAKALNCQQGISSTPCGVCDTCKAIDEGRFIDLIEVDAASRTKVDDTREILDNVQFAPTQGRYKVYLIDEVHMLSKSSFNALLKTLEEPPEHVKFLLATTDPHKLPITVLSRCLQFNLMRLTQAQIQGHLQHILQQEGLPFDEAALALIAKSADGSARDSLSLLDQAIAYGAGRIEFDAVQTMLGLVDQQFTLAILEALAAQSPEALKQVIQQLAQMGVDYAALLAQLIETLHALAFQQVLGEVAEPHTLPPEVIAALAQQLPPERVQLLYQIALLARQDMPLAPDVRIGFEMALLRMLAFQPVESGQAEAPTVSSTAQPAESAVTQGADAAQSSAQAGESPLAEVTLQEANPQEVLAALSSARALMGKKKPLTEGAAGEPPAPSAADASTAPFAASQTEGSAALEEVPANDWHGVQEPSSQAEYAAMQDAPPWELDAPAVASEQATSSANPQSPAAAHAPAQGDSADDHLTQIRQRLQQSPGKPASNEPRSAPSVAPLHANATSSAAASLASAARTNPAASTQHGSAVRAALADVQAPPALQAVPMPESAGSAQFAAASGLQPDTEPRIAPMTAPVATPASVIEPAEHAMPWDEPFSSPDDVQLGSPMNMPVSTPVNALGDVLGNASQNAGADEAHGSAAETTMTEEGQAAEQDSEQVSENESWPYPPLDDSNRAAVWRQLLDKVRPEGMAAELARHSILWRHSPDLWVLSVDPEQAFAKTDMAVLRLSEAVQAAFGEAVSLQFTQAPDEVAIETPALYQARAAQARQQAAEQAIAQDGVVSALKQELGMEVIASSIAPREEANS